MRKNVTEESTVNLHPPGECCCLEIGSSCTKIARLSKFDCWYDIVNICKLKIKHPAAKAPSLPKTPALRRTSSVAEQRAAEIARKLADFMATNNN